VRRGDNRRRRAWIVFLCLAVVLAFRWDGRRSGLFFQTRPGSYNDVALIGFLNALQRHFRGRRLILIWDGLPSHKSRDMRRKLWISGRPSL